MHPGQLHSHVHAYISELRSLSSKRNTISSPVTWLEVHFIGKAEVEAENNHTI